MCARFIERNLRIYMCTRFSRAVLLIHAAYEFDVETFAFSQNRKREREVKTIFSL